MTRTTLAVFIASSLDGYIATRDGSLAWLEEAASGDEDHGLESVRSWPSGFVNLTCSRA